MTWRPHLPDDAAAHLAPLGLVGGVLLADGAGRVERRVPHVACDTVPVPRGRGRTAASNCSWHCRGARLRPQASTPLQWQLSVSLPLPLLAPLAPLAGKLLQVLPALSPLPVSFATLASWFSLL